MNGQCVALNGRSSAVMQIQTDSYPESESYSLCVKAAAIHLLILSTDLKGLCLIMLLFRYLLIDVLSGEIYWLQINQLPMIPVHSHTLTVLNGGY